MWAFFEKKKKKKLRKQNIHGSPMLLHIFGEKWDMKGCDTLHLTLENASTWVSHTGVPQALMELLKLLHKLREWAVKKHSVQWQAGVRPPWFTRHIIRKRKSSNVTPLVSGNKSTLFQSWTPPNSCKTSWWPHKALVTCISAKQRLLQVDWLVGNCSDGQIRRTLPPCPWRKTETMPRTGSVKHCFGGHGSKRYARGKIWKIH